MKILLPVDGSACALRAVDTLVAQLADWRETPEIHLLHVHPPIPIGLVQAHISHDTLQQHYREESEAEMLPARQRLEAAGVVHTVHIHVGQPAEIIVRMAGEMAVDLILMGTHGLGAMGMLVLGSVAAKVVHSASCPVELVK